MKRDKQASTSTGFPERLRQVIAEFGSRYALAKSSRIPASTLQSYEAGSKPGIEALTTLARVANVDLNWLATGQGEMRPAGLLSGASLADFLVVDQYELGSALSMPIIIGQIPFSRHYLEADLRIKNPSHDSLLLVEANVNLVGVVRGDLVLVDRNRNDLARDGIYLLDLPGIVLRTITRCVGDMVRVMEPDHTAARSSQGDHRGRLIPATVAELPRSELLGAGHSRRSIVVGQAIWVGRAI
ncbi:MAG TPA: helix-turn-helix domain-containing protein [Candidatus Binataceae bacterium]|nr:helix-turn-helix domain-containing protein [Candidatus Binataceae bacterium]